MTAPVTLCIYDDSHKAIMLYKFCLHGILITLIVPSKRSNIRKHSNNQQILVLWIFSQVLRERYNDFRNSVCTSICKLCMLKN